MKLLLKSTKENYNKGEKQEEDNLNYYFKIRFNLLLLQQDIPPIELRYFTVKVNTKEKAMALSYFIK